VQPAPLRRRWLVAIGALAVLGAGVLGLWAVRSHPAIDEQWLHLAIGLRGPGWDQFALGLNYLGGGVIGVFGVPILGTALLAWRVGRWPAAFFLAASAASALVVQVLKAAFDRARPEQILVATDEGSFPSGHTANAATMAGAVYTLLMALSRTYLGAHWLTDTLGGLLVGAGVAVLCWAAFASRLRDPERSPDQPRTAG
jgi:undecaprenyl-diphosphatase